MPIPPLNLIDGVLFIDNSTLDSLACPRKFEYESLHRLVAAEESQALNFGRANHDLLELRYARSDLPLISIEPLQGEAASQFYEVSPVHDGDWRDLNFLMQVTRRYNALHPVEPFEVCDYPTPITCPRCNGEKGERICIWCNGTGHRAKMVEMSFAVPLYTHLSGLPVVYTGRIDLATRDHGRFNHITVVDHKTDKILGPKFFDQYRMSSQMYGYCWAFQQCTGITPWGFMVNAIRTREPLVKMRDGTASKAEIEKWWQESFFRGEEPIYQWQLDEWKTNTISRVDTLLYRHSTGYMPRESKECARWGRCPFYDVCALPPEQRQDLLDSTQFKIRDWSPLSQPNKQPKP